jgi:hypothetical protein
MPIIPRRPHQLDDKLVGITFIDVLFALVIGQLLQPFATTRHVPLAGTAHLLVGGVVTIASWIGYHNSLSRPHYVIRFVNLPLAQFLIDIALVVVYWLLAITAEGANPAIPRPTSAVPEARYVAVAFLLYGAWDLVALRIRRVEAAASAATGTDVPARRGVTYGFAVVSLLSWGLLSWMDPRSTPIVVVADAGLIVVAVAYRLAKEWVDAPATPGTPKTAVSSRPPPRSKRRSSPARQ